MFQCALSVRRNDVSVGNAWKGVVTSRCEPKWFLDLVLMLMLGLIIICLLLLVLVLMPPFWFASSAYVLSPMVQILQRTGHECAASES